jgi:hypothetical protein
MLFLPALKGGCSFSSYYRDIFSGLSNEGKLGPALSVGLHGLPVYFLSYHPFTSSALKGLPIPKKTKACFFLTGQGLALLKRNFCKKPKNPV